MSLVDAMMAVPSDQNVFEVARVLLLGIFAPTHDYPASFAPLLYFTCGAMSLVAICFIISYGIRIYKGSFHVYRWHQGFIHPHWTAWSLFELMLIILNQAATYWEIERARGIPNRIWQNWVFVPWIPGLLAGITALWTFAVSGLLQHRSTNGKTLIHRILTPTVLNIVFPLSLVIALGTSLGVTLKATIAWAAATDVYFEIDQYLMEQSAMFNGSWTPDQLAPIFVPLGQMGEEIGLSMNWVLKVLAVDIFWQAFIGIILLLGAFLQLRALRRMLNVTSFVVNTETAEVDLHSSRRRLQRTYRALVLTVCTFASLDIAALAGTSWIMNAQLHGAAKSSVTTLLLRFTYMTWLLPISIVMCMRALDEGSVHGVPTSVTSKDTRGAFAGKINVSRVQHSAVEHEHDRDGLVVKLELSSYPAVETSKFDHSPFKQPPSA